MRTALTAQDGGIEVHERGQLEALRQLCAEVDTPQAGVRVLGERTVPPLAHHVNQPLAHPQHLRLQVVSQRLRQRMHVHVIRPVGILRPCFLVLVFRIGVVGGFGKVVLRLAPKILLEKSHQAVDGGGTRIAHLVHGGEYLLAHRLFFVRKAFAEQCPEHRVLSLEHVGRLA